MSAHVSCLHAADRFRLCVLLAVLILYFVWAVRMCHLHTSDERERWSSVGYGYLLAMLVASTIVAVLLPPVSKHVFHKR